MKPTQFKAYFLREASAAAHGWTLCLAPSLLLGIGLSIVARGLETESASVLLLHVLLYLLPLGALLTGIGAARNDRAESQLLASLPAGAGGRVFGKFALFALVFGGSALGLTLPSFVTGHDGEALLRLWVFAILVSSAFLALGLCIGFRIRNAAWAYLAAAIVLLATTFGFGKLARIAEASGWTETYPDFALALLAASPLESLRVAVLASIEPASLGDARNGWLATIWRDNPNAFFVAIALLWTALALAASKPREE